MESRRRKVGRLPTGSLRDKLRDHYNQRNFTASETTITRFAISFLWINSLSVLLELVVLLIPDLQSPGDPTNNCSYRYAQLFCVWLLVQVACRWRFLHRGDGNVVTKTTKERHFPSSKDTPPGWRRCVMCRVDSPPRSYHCNTCGLCILRRDHHCYFSGSCVGHYNQRHFVFFLLYVITGLGYAAIMETAYLSKEFPLLAVYSYIPGVALKRWWTGEATSTTLLVSTHIYINVVSLMVSIFYVSVQIRLVLTGQTSYEGMKGVTTFSRTVRENWRVTFGPLKHFLIMLLIPVQFVLPEPCEKVFNVQLNNFST